ncbi:MAG: hypothetical protein ABH880_02775 [Patescibacteria group bacterium]
MNDFQEKMIFQSGIEAEINGLNFQRERIFTKPEPNQDGIRVSPVHDADFYMILLRRLYRAIEKAAQYDSRIANLKGKYRELTKKIKIRDHFEHEVDMETIPALDGGIKVVTSVMINPTSPHIISGDQRWLLNEDHERFISLVKEFAELFPFKKLEEKL